MDIICSNDNQEKTVEGCFHCSLTTGGPPCGYDYALLRSIYGSSEKSERANSIHVTDLTGCPRRAYYDKREPSPEYPHEMLVRWMGSGFHSMVEGAVASQPTDEHLDSELPLEHDGIVGRSDLVYKDGRLVDLKFTRWMYVDKLPYGSHTLQVNIYAWMLRHQIYNRRKAINRLQIQYIDASGPTKCRKCKVPVRNIDGVLACPKCLTAPKGAHLGAYLVDIPMMSDEQVASAIRERKNDLEAALAMGMPPEPEPGFLCAYCSHAEKCGAYQTD
jgi:CRISPR/Cas system-associated exonuclease Cas4 (RecB family)